MQDEGAGQKQDTHVWIAHMRLRPPGHGCVELDSAECGVSPSQGWPLSPERNRERVGAVSGV